MLFDSFCVWPQVWTFPFVLDFAGWLWWVVSDLSWISIWTNELIRNIFFFVCRIIWRGPRKTGNWRLRFIRGRRWVIFQTLKCSSSELPSSHIDPTYFDLNPVSSCTPLPPLPHSPLTTRRDWDVIQQRRDFQQFAVVLPEEKIIITMQIDFQTFVWLNVRQRKIPPAPPCKSTQFDTQ